MIFRRSSDTFRRISKISWIVPKISERYRKLSHTLTIYFWSFPDFHVIEVPGWTCRFRFNCACAIKNWLHNIREKYSISSQVFCKCCSIPRMHKTRFQRPFIFSPRPENLLEASHTTAHWNNNIADKVFIGIIRNSITKLSVSSTDLYNFALFVTLANLKVNVHGLIHKQVLKLDLLFL